MRTLVTLGIILLIIFTVTVWLVQRSHNSTPSIEIVASHSTTTQKIRFVAPDTLEVVEVAFSENIAVLNGKRYQNLLLTPTETVSGTRYVSTLENISILNEGDEIKMYRGREIIFTGYAENSVKDTDLTVPASSTTSEATLLSGNT